MLSCFGWPLTSATRLIPKLSCSWDVLIKKVQNDIGIGAALQFDHAAHTVLIGFVANEGHAVNFLFSDELSDLLKEQTLVDLIRNLVDDDGFAGCRCPILQGGSWARIIALPRPVR